ncbi:hypothetical protein ACQPZ2_30370 [Nocardia pseudovaccinii]|uniref:hypothetical protein n=1 Tax=Nocardia pseudovaccinii TaxID=189540 RepID=UPI003D907CF2
MHAMFTVNRPLDFYAYSIPPHEDNDGKSWDPSITVELFGQTQPKEPSVHLSMNLEEAEEFAAKLASLVAAARAGEYSDRGREVVDYSGEKDVQRARRVIARHESR